MHCIVDWISAAHMNTGQYTLSARVDHGMLVDFGTPPLSGPAKSELLDMKRESNKAYNKSIKNKD